MSNLYIFAIGGTGARVLRSLGILLASGLKVNANKIIPIIIDTDSQNRDTLRTINLLNDYREIRNQIPNLKNSFFHNTICSLSDLGREKATATLGDSFLLKLQDTNGKSFSDYINYTFIQDYETKCLINLLYSEDNLNDSLTYGFLGSPNVGCVVLDSINKTTEFQNFGNLFQPGDRIFIISSIFGGTGAAGFPLLLNNFRLDNPNLANSNALKNAIIGAVSVLPYFTLNKNNDSRIDSSSFFTKSIAALSYYEENIQKVNSLYYIGDASHTNSYTNVEGGNEQKNDANFVELAAALSIYDFMQTPDETLRSDHLFKEFSVLEDAEKLRFDQLGKKNTDIIAKNLTSLKLFELMKNEVKSKVGAAFMIDNQLESDFFISGFYQKLESFFTDHYATWSKEIERNTRGFIPFTDVSPSDLSALISGKQISKNLFGRSQLSVKEFINTCSKTNSKESDRREKFIDLMGKATSEIFDKNLSTLIN